MSVGSGEGFDWRKGGKEGWREVWYGEGDGMVRRFGFE